MGSNCFPVSATRRPTASSTGSASRRPGWTALRRKQSTIETMRDPKGISAQQDLRGIPCRRSARDGEALVGSRAQTQGPSVVSPIRTQGCFFVIAYSSGVSRPGLRRMESGKPIFPMS